MLTDEGSIQLVVPLTDSRVFACQAPSADFAHGRRRVAESSLVRDVHPEAAMIESGAFPKAEVSACLKSDRRCCEDPVDRDVPKVPSKSRRGRKLVVELEKNFAHAKSRESLINIAVANIAVCIKHYYYLFAGSNPFRDFRFKIAEKGFTGAAIVVLVIQMVHVLTVRALRALRKTWTIRRNDFERHRSAALVPRPSPATESGRISAAA